MIEKGISRTVTLTMRDSTTGQPKTTLVAGDVTVKISKDGAAFAAVTNAPVAIQDTAVNTGEFALTLTVAEMTADAIVIKATAAACIEVRSKIATEASYTAVKAGYLTGAVALDSTVAKEGNIETHVTASLNTYDPPTRTEATADKDAIIVQVDANETKIDTLLIESQSHPTLAEIEATTVLAKEATLTAQATKIIFIEKWINNKLVEAPTGTWKLYDDDNVTVLKTWTWNAGTLTRSKAV